MRKVLIALAAAGSALAMSAPAAAQYFPAPQPYGSPYGNAYGYNNYGQVRRLQARIDQLQYQIQRLDRRGPLSEREARRLRDESRDLERRLAFAARNGLYPAEAQNIEYRIARLEQRIWREANDGRGRWNGGYGYNKYGQNGQWGERDRDRDGRDDRWDDDRSDRD